MRIPKKQIDFDNPSLCIVIGLSCVAGLNTIRSIGRKNIDIIGFDNSQNGLAKYSKYCTHFIYYSDHAQLLKEMIEIGELLKHKIPVIVSADQLVIFMDDNKDRLSKYYLFNWQKKHKMRDLTDKKKMLRLAKDAGIGIPLTFFSDIHSIDEMIDKITFPSFVKPAFTNTRIKGIIVNSKEEFLQATEKVFLKDGYIVQEFLEGPETDIIVAGSYSNRAGKILAVVMGQTKRQLPMKIGIKTLIISIQSPIVEKEVIKFLEAIEYFGIADTEFKKSEKDGEYKFIEFNPRISGIDQFYIANGINLPLIFYQDLKNEHCSFELNRYKKNVKWISLLKDLNTIIRFYVRKNPFYFVRWIWDIIQANSYAVFAMDDLNPFFIEVRETIRAVRLKFLK